jgi:hypothetical protein
VVVAIFVKIVTSAVAEISTASEVFLKEKQPDSARDLTVDTEQRLGGTD